MRASLFAGLLTSAAAFSPVPLAQQSTTELQALSRKDFLTSSLATAVAGAAFLPNMAFADDNTFTTPSGVTVVKNKIGSGEQPSIGELCGIRFRAFNGNTKIDDIFDTPEPYYTRAGSGGMLKGVEEILPMMRLGDNWTLTIPSNLAFGPKGRPASAGKPRIAGDATIVFEVEMVAIPGKEPELIELIGDS